MYTSLFLWLKALVMHIQRSPTLMICTKGKPGDFGKWGMDSDATNWPKPGYCSPAAFLLNCFRNLSIANPISTSHSLSFGYGTGMEDTTGSLKSVSGLLSMAVSLKNVLPTVDSLHFPKMFFFCPPPPLICIHSFTIHQYVQQQAQ